MVSLKRISGLAGLRAEADALWVKAHLLLPLAGTAQAVPAWVKESRFLVASAPRNDNQQGLLNVDHALGCAGVDFIHSGDHFAGEIIE